MFPSRPFYPCILLESAYLREGHFRYNDAHPQSHGSKGSKVGSENPSEYVANQSVLPEYL